jgi:hypothetical protein
MVINLSFKSSACVLITTASYTLISQTLTCSPSIIALAIYTLLGGKTLGLRVLLRGLLQNLSLERAKSFVTFDGLHNIAARGFTIQIVTKKVGQKILARA